MTAAAPVALMLMLGAPLGDLAVLNFVAFCSVIIALQLAITVAMIGTHHSWAVPNAEGTVTPARRVAKALAVLPPVIPTLLLPCFTIALWLVVGAPLLLALVGFVRLGTAVAVLPISSSAAAIVVLPRIERSKRAIDHTAARLQDLDGADLADHNSLQRYAVASRRRAERKRRPRILAGRIVAC